MQVIDTSEISRTGWLELRRQSIGASDAPVIAGLSKYKSRLALYLEKIGEVEPEEAGEEAWWGTNLENVIETRLYEQYQVVSDDCQVMIRHPERAWQTATLDMVDSTGRVWEFKAVGIGTAKSLVDGDAKTLPDSWILQAHHQMMCAETDRINFAVFVGHRLKLYRFDVEWNDEIGEGLLQLETEFRRRIETRTIPTEFDPEDAALLLKHFKGVEPAGIISADPVDLANARLYIEALQARKYAERQEQTAKAALLARMGNAESAQIGPHRFARKLISVKERTQTIKASSYIRFSLVNGSDDE